MKEDFETSGRSVYSKIQHLFENKMRRCCRWVDMVDVLDKLSIRFILRRIGLLENDLRTKYFTELGHKYSPGRQ